MAYEDDSYGLDADGNRILIGLTADETREFERLDESINSDPPLPTNDVRLINKRRWLVLFEKHETATRNLTTK
jgi:hypothetical protein